MSETETTVDSTATGPAAPVYADYSGDELLEQAQGNAQAALIATVAFLRAREIAVEEWAAALGVSFALEWGEPEPWAPDEFLDAMLTNYRSLGATVSRADLGQERAEAEITGFPDPEQCERFGVAVAEVARFHDTAVAIAQERGLRWTWSLDDPATARTRLVVAPAGT